MISFIVPAFNEAALIGATVDALHAAGDALDDAYEVIVVDDASTDDTASLARAHGAKVTGVNLRNIAATRNAGARAATGKFLIFVDADTLVTPGVTRAAVAAMRDGAVGGGAALRFDGVVPLFARLLTPPTLWIFRLAGVAPGCFLFCTRDAFHAVGGFDETFYGAEDLVMSGALKRYGRFTVLREMVVTSGRKLRTHSIIDVLRPLLRMGWRGTSVIKQREGMELWYGERRDDADE